LLLLWSMRHSRADSSFLFLRLSGASGTSRIAFLEAAVFFSPHHKCNRFLFRLLTSSEVVFQRTIAALDHN
jgi:hypothetical protein